MEQRTRQRLRRLVELNVEAVERGVMPMSKAAEVMESAGVRFDVVCRVLLPFKNGIPRRMGEVGATSGAGKRRDETAAG